MKKIVIIGAGVAGINAATKLVDNGYDGSLITIIDKGNDPINRLPEEVMTGMLGAGGWSDGKLTYHTAIGGQLAKYCGEEKAMELMKQVVDNFTRFHPKPDEIFMSDPQEEPEFIKPYFGLRMFPVWHIGSNFLHEIAKTWYSYLVDKGVNFIWNTEVDDIDFKNNKIYTNEIILIKSYVPRQSRLNHHSFPQRLHRQSLPLLLRPFHYHRPFQSLHCLRKSYYQHRSQNRPYHFHYE